jgi:tRNA-binding protein
MQNVKFKIGGPMLKTFFNFSFLILHFMLAWSDFEKVDIRVGTIVEVNDFPKARKPAYKLLIDFGELGMKRSSAQITKFYTKENLQNKQVIAVVNFPPKQIADFISECLVLGVYTAEKDVVLLQPERPVGNGWKIG